MRTTRTLIRVRKINAYCQVTAWSSFKISPFFSHSGSTLQDKDEDPVPAETGQNHPFFRRSDSMTFLGCIPPNPFDVPLPEAIPLADQPHLLQVSVADQNLCVSDNQDLFRPKLVCIRSIFYWFKCGFV